MEATTDTRHDPASAPERLICSIFAAAAISDFLQIFYKGSEEKLL